MPSRVVLAYSGGLDTSAIIPWLVERFSCDVIAVVGDVGQGDNELRGIEDRARQSGASQCYVVDLKREFIEAYAYPTLMSGAIYEGRYLLGTAIARPILAKAQVELARQVGADALAHGCTGKGNDQVRFESAFAALAPDLDIIAPWRMWSMRSREDLLAYLEQRNLPTTATAEKIYSRDANLWHISHEGGELEDPWNSPPEDMWLMTASTQDAPREPEDITIGFEAGRPCSINGDSMPPETLVATLNTRAGRHGIGRIDLIENRLVGMKSRGCYETPGGTVLAEAMRALVELVLDRRTTQVREWIALRFAELVYNGEWFTPAREALSAAIEKSCEKLTGEVVVRLHRGTAVTVQRRSENSLFSHDYATFGKANGEEVYEHSHAEGFIRLFALPSRIAATLQNAGRA